MNVPDKLKPNIEAKYYKNTQIATRRKCLNLLQKPLSTTVLKQKAHHAKLRRTAHALRIQVKAQIEEMLENGFNRKCSSLYAATIVMTLKMDGGFVDYRKFNETTITDKYSITDIADPIDELSGATFFSSLDLFSGYWQLGLHDEDKHKTAFTCELRQFEFYRLQFGLTIFLQFSTDNE